MSGEGIRIGIDVGGTFTDFALGGAHELLTSKVLTTHQAPEQAILQGLQPLLAEAGCKAGDVELIIHGTTLATNAIIERKGAKVAMLTTEGYRDVLELGTESRFDQYDLNLVKPRPLVPRALRYTVAERLAADGQELIALDLASIPAIAGELEEAEIASLAICFLHSFVNPAHEQAAAEELRKLLPDLHLSLSSEVAPEIREYERFSTTVANAYLQPLVDTYLLRLEQQLRAAGFVCPVYLFLSNGGLAELEIARRFPIRLVESGPAGGAVFASHVARRHGEDRILSFDMGGTTAKICLIDDAQPQKANMFEMARVHRFKQGSGLPARIPVIEMVEIGAGGGSIARVDNLGRITVGPDSAGSEPGPACYDRGGNGATVTDADLILGRLGAEGFADGSMTLNVEAARSAIKTSIADPLDMEVPPAAFGIAEIVEEDMANAAREHATESGKSLLGRTLIAFGGAAPIHALSLAAKLGIDRVIIPANAGVGSAVGFLIAPVAFELSRSCLVRLSDFQPGVVNKLLADMCDYTHSVVESGAPQRSRTEVRQAQMRYVGQGYNIPVELPLRDLQQSDLSVIVDAFNAAYINLYKKLHDGVDIEIVGVSVSVSAYLNAPQPMEGAGGKHGSRDMDHGADVFDSKAGQYQRVSVYARDTLAVGMSFSGPALIRDQGTTVTVPDGHNIVVAVDRSLVIEKQKAKRERKATQNSSLHDIQFQVIWRRLIAIVEEQARTLMKTAFSPVVRESGDLSAALFDPQGRMLAQAITGTPGHVNSTAAAVPHFLAAYPPDTLMPGDHLITNDPWIASGHLHDVTVVSPIFIEEMLVALFACTCHQLDIGGLGQGPDAKSVYEEGLHIPILKLVKAGDLNQDLMEIIQSNVRTPFEVRGDILSYVAANETSGSNLLALITEYELADLSSVGDEIIERSKQGMLAEIRKLPKATTHNTIRLDGYDKPVEIVCALTIGEDEVQVDFSGSTEASTKGINLVLNYTQAYANYGIRCVVGAHIPNNSGSLSPIKISAPEGSILNVQRPWPVCARHIIGQFLPDAVMGCLAELLPERVPAEGASALWGVQMRGGPEVDAACNFDRAGAEAARYEVLIFNSGGTGATPEQDGMSATGFPSGVRAMPIEVVENMGPVVVWRKELRPDSGGAGQWRGGMGQIVEVGTRDGSPFLLFAMFDRTDHPAHGRLGGAHGATGIVRIKDGEQLQPKGAQLIAPGQRLELLLPGGGGFGPVENRSAELLDEDRLSGAVG